MTVCAIVSVASGVFINEILVKAQYILLSVREREAVKLTFLTDTIQSNTSVFSSS